MAESSRLGRPARKTSLDCDRVLWIQVFRNFPKGISMRNRSSTTSWCVAAGVLVLAIAQIAHGQTYTYSVLYGFKNNGKDPSNVYASLIVDSAGNLYGASNNGGSHNLGSVFKVTKSGTLTVLHSFTGKPDGENPQASVIRDSAGNLYGTTLYGGAFNAGAVFKISPSDQETILFNSFEKTGTNGGYPYGVVRDSAGNLYGTTLQGGSFYSGVAFRLDTADDFTILHDFCSGGPPDCSDGEEPLNLITAGANFYGVTEHGGDLGFGTVFEMTPQGVETVLHTFEGSDGQLPNGSLRQDTKGNLYGVAFEGGTNNGGTLFEQPETGGPARILYNFGSLPNCADGCFPQGPVAIDKTGNIYGIAHASAAFTPEQAVVWEVNTSGKESIVYTFDSTVTVLAGAIIDSVGNLYGTTQSGGSSNLGVLYKLTLQK
jgi:uncharacterized repeat protein (TIGR03803 family)